MKKKAIILGAGPTGLITAWLLQKKGWSTQVYEKSKIVGGMCRSWNWKNFIVDTGPHIFHTSNIKLWNFWKKNFSDLFIEGKYYSKNIINDDFNTMYDYPLSYEGLKKFPKEIKSQIFSELKNIKKNLNIKNFEQHVSNQVGNTLQSMFFKEYPEKVWGINTSEMTSDWAPKRIKFTNKTKPFFNTEKTAVGKYGTGSIYENIKERILNLGGKINLSHEVIKIQHIKNKINKIHFKNKKSVSLENEDIIISTLPITFTSKLLGFKSNLKFRGIRSIYLAVNKRRVLPKNVNWLYFGSKKVIFNRISEPKTMSKYVSTKDKTYLCAEITYFKKDKVDQMNFEKIKKIVLDDLEKTGLIKKKDVFGVSENKEDFVYPVQFVDYRYELSKTSHAVSKFSQLYSMGTGGEFDYSDSQIIYLKSMDMVEVLDNKFAKEDQTRKDILSNKLNKIVKLAKNNVGEDQPVYIIAEAGLNHNGNIEIAKKLIDEAKKTKCNAIKFQTFNPSKRISRKVKSANYAEKADGLQEDIYEMFKRLSLSKKDHLEIFNYAKKKNIEIFSTPFDVEDVDFLEKLGVNFYKIASVDLVNLDLITKVGKTGKPCILSTGMSEIGNIDDAVKCFKNTGNKNLILLHCLSSYPANASEMNLRVINTLKNLYNIPVGLSDHYPGLEMSLISITLGANIIERHFTLDKTMEGPDHILSSETKELKKLVSISKNIKNILGTGEKIIQPSEFININNQRKCLYVKKKLRKGQKINLSNIVIKGPAGGILPKYKNLIIGKTVKKIIEADNPIKWDSITK